MSDERPRMLDDIFTDERWVFGDLAKVGFKLDGRFVAHLMYDNGPYALVDKFTGLFDRIFNIMNFHYKVTGVVPVAGDTFSSEAFRVVSVSERWFKDDVMIFFIKNESGPDTYFE